MDQIPRMSDLLGPAVVALLGDLTGGRRVARERYAQSGETGGRFGDVLRGWQGQAEIVRARLVKEVMATRLDRCGGQELRDLAKSEYFADLPPDPQKAVGHVTLRRTVVLGSATPLTGNFAFGVIPAGTKIKRQGSPTGTVPSQDAEYETTEAAVCGTDDNLAPAPVGDGTFTHQQTVFIPVRATREGPHANIPYYVGIAAQGATVSSSLFDKFTVTALESAGGTLGVVDDQVRALARAMAVGSNGPTSRAAIAGSLTSPSVRRAVYVDDTILAIGTLFLSDESWATSLAFRQAQLQALRERPWIGWGCRVNVGFLNNLGVVVAPKILLRSSKYDTAQSDITENVKTALVRYFDERPDFYTWTLNAIGAVIAGADKRILACTAVSVTDVDGALIAAVDEFGAVTGAEPAITVPSGAQSVFRYGLIGQAVNPTYSVPGG